MKSLFTDIGLKRCAILSVLMVVLAVSTSACGRKADPAFPDDATYPEEYPTE